MEVHAHVTIMLLSHTAKSSLASAVCFAASICIKVGRNDKLERHNVQSTFTSGVPPLTLAIFLFAEVAPTAFNANRVKKVSLLCPLPDS